MLPVFLKERVDRFYEQRLGRHGGQNVFNGRIPGPDAVLLNGNDYLNLSRHPAIVEAQVTELRRAGSGPQMSAVFLNEIDGDCTRTQARLAAFTNMEAAVLCQSGYAANVGLVQAIADRRRPVYLDRFAHMSLWEGARSAGARARMFLHNRPEHLADRVRRFGPGTIIVDALYSAVGTIAPLREIARIATESGSTLVVDESHSLGLYGPGGAGLVAELGLSDDVDFITASLAKAFASRAGLICGPRRVLSYFPWESRHAIFSTMLEPHDIARIAATLEVVQREAWRCERVHANAAVLRNHLILEGYECAAISASPIIALIAGSEENTVLLRDSLEAHEVFGAVFVQPTTPPERSLLRLSVHAGLSISHLERVCYALSSVRDTVRPGDWPDPWARS
ncbi:MAG: quorum-sensing autoinducer CAI-1 synthase [bacterium]|nr:quorum-sensing autoinducer CAI-1 synthase [bacterium]